MASASLAWVSNVGLLPFDEVDGRPQRQRVEALGVDLEGLVDGLARVVAAAIVERHLGHQELGGHGIRVDLQRLVDGFLGRRRVARRRHRRQAEPGRHVGGIGLQRRLKRLQRLRAIVFLEEQFTPRGVDDRVVRAPAWSRCDRGRWRPCTRPARGQPSPSSRSRPPCAARRRPRRAATCGVRPPGVRRSICTSPSCKAASPVGAAAAGAFNSASASAYRPRAIAASARRAGARGLCSFLRIASTSS